MKTISQITTKSEVRNRLILLMFFFFSFTVIVNSQENLITEKWTDNTAFLLPAGKWESGIFQSFRLGLKNKIEVRSYGLLMPILPNGGIKFSVRSGEGVNVATESSVSYPTLFLNAVSFKGTGGLISPQFSFPFMVNVSNTIIASKQIGKSSIANAFAGFSFTLRNGKPDYQSSIDIPNIYQRMAQYYEGVSIKSGISFKGTIAKNLYFEQLVRIILITRTSDNIFIENSGSVMWSAKGSLRIKGGYLFSWGDYPFGYHTQLWPALDFIFGSRTGKTKN
ncbi:MAG TPA: hypothetical protein DEO60_09565 [Bacteroidales bacterium]|nr:hypothetical protein [Bacteroidales bacterium]